MKKFLVGFGVIGSLYGINFNGSIPVTSSLTFNSIPMSIVSNEDKNNLEKFKCFNAFSIIFNEGKKFYIPSIITQVQNEKFYLIIINKCENTNHLNITLIDKNTGKDIKNYTINLKFRNIIGVNIKNSYKDLLVHFDYDKINGKGNGTCYWSKTSKIVCTGNAKPVVTHHEENSTDDFAVRPKQFNISTNSIAFVGKNLKVNLNVTGDKGKISTNYNSNDMELNTKVINSNGNENQNAKLSYFYNIKNGKIDRYQFFFTKPDKNYVKIKISEKPGKEWAIVDEDDTNNNRRFISEGESNSITVNETSKNWAGIGTDEKENSPTNKTIQSDIRDNVNKNLRFNRINW